MDECPHRKPACDECVEDEESDRHAEELQDKMDSLGIGPEDHFGY
jgi:hypothetical protein